jgi:hypothetical protein
MCDRLIPDKVISKANAGDKYELITMDVATGKTIVILGMIHCGVKCAVLRAGKKTIQTSMVVIKLRDTKSYVLSGCVARVDQSLFVISGVLSEDINGGYIVAFGVMNHSTVISVLQSIW